MSGKKVAGRNIKAHLRRIECGDGRRHAKNLAEIWPNITERKEPAPDAEDWAGKPGKLELLER